MNLIRASQLLWVFSYFINICAHVCEFCVQFFLLEHISSYFLIKYDMYVFTLPFTNSGSKQQIKFPMAVVVSLI